MKYKFEQHNESNYRVVETPTGNVIKTQLSKDQARALSRSLNFGGGFDGFTPDFILRK